jgi:hypothetical protein
LVVEPSRFLLNCVIWQGRDDGSDAAVYVFSTGSEGA